MLCPRPSSFGRGPIKMTKKCTKCLEVKPIDLFYNNKTRKDGKTEICKKCTDISVKEYQKTDKRKAYIKKWRIENKDRCHAYHKKWAQNNSDYCSERTAKRVAFKLNATPKWLTEKDLKNISEYYETAKILTKLNGEKYSVDHIKPLRGKTMCGLNVPWNLQIIPAYINSKKSNKIAGRVYESF